MFTKYLTVNENSPALSLISIELAGKPALGHVTYRVTEIESSRDIETAHLIRHPTGVPIAGTQLFPRPWHSLFTIVRTTFRYRTDQFPLTSSVLSDYTLRLPQGRGEGYQVLARNRRIPDKFEALRGPAGVYLLRRAAICYRTTSLRTFTRRDYQGACAV